MRRVSKQSEADRQPQLREILDTISRSIQHLRPSLLDIEVRLYTLVQVEIKGLGVGRELLDRDRIKIFFRMKKSFDALCQAGVDGSTVGILVQGLRAEVWIMEIPFEGDYIPTHVGSFSLIHANLAFGSILALAAPMLIARRAVQQTLQKLRGARRAAPIKSADRRGQYDLLSVLVPVEEKTDEEATEGDDVIDESTI
ncbi:hypothetical protein BGX31_007614 [Mortierella sp. GBA43]|nr:hypothetical protein BGX31_007614 [Mortierella sp. GBA43]